MGKINSSNPTGPKWGGQGFLPGGPQTHAPYQAKGHDRRTLTNQTPIDRHSFVIEGQGKGNTSVTAQLIKEKALVVVTEGDSDRVCYFADHLAPRKAVRLIAELIEGEASVVVTEGDSDRVCYFAQDLTPEKAVKLVEDIREGTIGLEELRKQEGREIEGELSRIVESVGAVATETAISVFSGWVGEVMVTLLGPVGAILLAGGVAAAARESEEISAVSGMVGGVMVTLLGPVGAILLAGGVAAAATTFKKT